MTLHISLQILFHETDLEDIVSGGNGRVGREDQRRPQHLAGGREIEAVLFHEHPGALKPHQKRMPFVHVIDHGIDPEGLQGLHPPDAEDDLLPQSVLHIAGVESAGDVPVFRVIFFQVGVEQVERNPPDLASPDLREALPAGKVHGYFHWFPILAGLQGEDHVVEVIVGRFLLLPSVPAQVLGEIAVLVQKAYAAQRKPQVARALEVIACKDAQSPGIDGKALGNSELHGKIGDGEINGLGQEKGVHTLFGYIILEGIGCSSHL